MLVKDRYINPFTDFGFNKIFGSEVNKDLLIAFLNTLLPAEAGTVSDLSFLPNERVGRSEPPKFTKTIEELATEFDKWCFLLRHLPELTDRPARLQEKVFLKVFELAEIARYSVIEADAYEESIKVYRDLKNVFDTAYEDGKAAGMAEALAEGIQQKALEDANKFKDAGVNIETIGCNQGEGGAWVTFICKGICRSFSLYHLGDGVTLCRTLWKFCTLPFQQRVLHHSCLHRC